jgi:hypothetical protein
MNSYPNDSLLPGVEHSVFEDHTSCKFMELGTGAYAPLDQYLRNGGKKKKRRGE